MARWRIFLPCYARPNAGTGIKGLNFFFIPADLPGVSTSPKFDKLGTKATEISELAFTDVFIPEENRLGEDGMGFRNLFSILAEIRTMTAALAVGLSRAAFDAAKKYAMERTQFGRPIGKFQLIQSKIAQMAINIHASNLMTYEAASGPSTGAKRP